MPPPVPSLSSLIKIKLLVLFLGCMYGSSHSKNGNNSDVSRLASVTESVPVPLTLAFLIFFLSLVYLFRKFLSAVSASFP